MTELPTSPEPAGHSRMIVPDQVFLAALTEFSAAAGHEINNPLAVILGRVQLLLPEESDPARRQSLETIAGQALRIRDMIGDVMLFADPPPPNPVQFPLDQVLKELETHVYQEHRFQVGEHRPEYTWSAAEGMQIYGDLSQFRTVLAEILWNAFHPTVQAKCVRLQAVAETEDSGYCLVKITDDGRGLTAEEAVHLFNPFYSGRQAGRGLGFGLCKVWRLASLNGATVRVASRRSASASQETTEFSLRWPMMAIEEG